MFITLVVAVVQSQPVPCLEDTQCPDNFFCKVPTHVCRECLDCRELNRSLPLNLKAPNKCVKTEEDCGPCVEGFVPAFICIFTCRRGLGGGAARRGGAGWRSGSGVYRTKSQLYEFVCDGFVDFFVLDGDHAPCTTVLYVNPLQRREYYSWPKTFMSGVPAQAQLQGF